MELSVACAGLPVGSTREVFSKTEVLNTGDTGICFICGTPTTYVDTYHRAYICSSGCIDAMLHNDWYNAVSDSMKVNKR